jgi:hypothetical protein
MTINKNKIAKQLKGMSPGELKARTGSSIKNKQTNAKLAKSFLSDIMGKYKKTKRYDDYLKGMSPGKLKAITGRTINKLAGMGKPKKNTKKPRKK